MAAILNTQKYSLEQWQSKLGLMMQTQVNMMK